MNKGLLVSMKGLSMRKTIAFLLLVSVAPLCAVKDGRLLTAIKNDDFKAITVLLTPSLERVGSTQSLGGIVAQLQNEDYHVRAATVWALAVLAKQEKLPVLTYKAWSQAANEPEYVYNSKPYWADACRTTIYQLGIHETDKGRMGMAHAIAAIGTVSKALRRTTMSEEFFVVDGQGEFWLKNADNSIEQFTANIGAHFLNPCGQTIQFRNTGHIELKLLVTTTPPYDDTIRADHYAEDLAKEIVVTNDGPWPVK
jgi:mannose-6-phosphate isomerase-like protein (cupin superfamily)